MKNWKDDDYYDSDDDTYLDRTGVVEKKRERRMKELERESSISSSSNPTGKAITYNELVINNFSYELFTYKIYFIEISYYNCSLINAKNFEKH